MTDSPASSGVPEEVLAQATHLLAPLVRLLIHHGVDHPRLAAALKRVFVDQALAERAAQGDAAPTHTAVSLLTGLQRRDVKALREGGSGRFPAKALTPTLPMQAVTRWTQDARFTDAAGRPLPLPLRSVDDRPSFEELADSLSKDVHAPALRDELVRLGLVRDDDGLATLLAVEFLPLRDPSQLLGALARNGHDHLAAAVENLLRGKHDFLEYALVADELSPASVQALHELARKLWAQSYRKAVQAASEFVARDKAAGFDAEHPEMRLRFGVYFYSEPVQRAAATSQPEDPR